MRLLIFVFLMSLALPALVDQDVPHPIVEKSVPQFALPKDLNSFSDERLIKMKEEYLKHLRRYQEIVNNSKKGNKVLLKALQAYDVQRAGIVRVIHQLIDSYKIDKPIAKKMRAYAARFTQIHEHHQDETISLDNYASYDFQLGITYTSFLKMLESYPDIYKRLQRDMDDEKTVIGAYVKSLDTANQAVEKASAEIEEIYIVRQLELSIRQIDNELISRI